MVASGQMNMRNQKMSVTEQAKQALADIGGEPLAGSGFEDETPEAEFSDTAPAAVEPRQ
jgi:hypothetical protein